MALGLLAGDALSPVNADFRIRLLSPKRLARMEALAQFSRETNTTTLARPYAHSSPPDRIQPGSGENIEWFAFSAGLFQRAKAARSYEPIIEEWVALASTDGVHARIGTHIALGNLRRGLRPPQSGHDNPHYFDDLAMVRAVAAVHAYDEEAEAVRAARMDASVTHALDGVWCAQATAVLFSQLRSGVSGVVAVDAAAEALPSDTWTHRLVTEAIDIAKDATGTLDRTLRLSRRVGDWIYSYPVTAPETLAFLLAHVANASTAEELMLGVLGHGRNAQTLPALAGAAAGLLFGGGWLPDDLTLALPLSGVAIPSLAGRAIDDLLSGAGPTPTPQLL